MLRKELGCICFNTDASVGRFPSVTLERTIPPFLRKRNYKPCYNRKCCMKVKTALEFYIAFSCQCETSFIEMKSSQFQVQHFPGTPSKHNFVSDEPEQIRKVLRRVHNTTWSFHDCRVFPVHINIVVVFYWGCMECVISLVLSNISLLQGTHKYEYISFDCSFFFSLKYTLF